MTHKNDGFIENLMKVPAPLNASINYVKHNFLSFINDYKYVIYYLWTKKKNRSIVQM